MKIWNSQYIEFFVCAMQYAVCNKSQDNLFEIGIYYISFVSKIALELNHHFSPFCNISLYFTYPWLLVSIYSSSFLKYSLSYINTGELSFGLYFWSRKRFWKNTVKFNCNKNKDIHTLLGTSKFPQVIYQHYQVFYSCNLSCALLFINLNMRM